MKAISIKQPWASLILDGYKTIETRTWSTPYRGDLLIVSSKMPNDAGPSGVMLCVVTVTDCHMMTKDDQAAACCDIYPKARSIVLSNVRPVKQSPVKGCLALYDVPDETIEYI